MCEMCLPYHEYHTPEHCPGCRIQADMGVLVPIKPKKEEKKDLKASE